MSASLEGQFGVALSSRALFDFEEKSAIFEDQDDSVKPALAFSEASLSDEAERVFQELGLAAFQNHEESHALPPLPPASSCPCSKPCTVCAPTAPDAR